MIHSHLRQEQPKAELPKIRGTGWPSKSPEAEQTVSSRPCLASRMFHLLFRRKRQLKASAQPNSWPGCPAPVLMTEDCAPSDNVCIPKILSSSARSVRSSSVTSPGRRPRPWREYEYEACGSTCKESNWRTLQSYCANCHRLFFTRLSELNGPAGRFCSLDCKTSCEYMSRLHDIMDAQMPGLFTDSETFEETDESVE
ncbi:hypothetical protein BBJ28_00023094 [Nothophytophthora sp. Chile5]|nr:hypothetical protein BBJ28_00023094 [Nothophytophthora sp. Chile5]